MIEIDKIYFFKTVDKSPFVYENQSTVFGDVDVNSVIPNLLDTLELVESIAIEFDECIRAYLDYDVNLDFEQNMPLEGAVPYQSNSIYNYRLNLVRENSNKAYSNEFTRYASYLASDVWQIAYHTIGNEWFICYAELGIINTIIDNNIIQSINFEALNAKEEIFNITAFTLI